MCLNQTSEWKVIAIWISPQLPLYNSERLDILWASIIHSIENLCPFVFAECFRVQFCGSRYMMHVNRTSEWKVIAIWIFWELPLFNFERLDISWASIIHSNQKLWPFEFSKSFQVQFWGSRYLRRVNRASDWKFIAIWILERFRCSILSVSIYHGHRSYIRVKGYGCLNLPRDSVFNFVGLDIWCMWIGHPSEKL